MFHCDRDEFNNDIHEIRAHNPKWRYAPAKRSAEELIDPMSKRLRPRDKIRSKMWSRDTEWEWGFSADDSDQSQSGSEGRHSPLQHSATTWKQCDVCNLWRPLPGHVDSDDLPKTWCCFMNPDSRFNRCWMASAPPPVYSGHCTTLPRQHTYTMAPSHCIAASRHTALSQCMTPAHQSSVLLLLPAVCSAASNIASGVLVSHTPLL
ncbi:uncharacterized protein [Littorina saxatilis]|uniref:CW-type domain-containing protein n=1 Tax=Littorina saxatilis TaxID=31220 RepID=A0AAN9C1D5_9CAEN